MVFGRLSDPEHAQIPPQTHHNWYGAILRKKNFSTFLKFFDLKSYAFWASRAFPGPQVNKNFIFSKSKPLNENRIDRFLIYVPLDLPLAWFGLNTHREKAYSIWKLVKIMFFHINFWKLWKKSNFRAEKSIFKFFFEIVW